MRKKGIIIIIVIAVLLAAIAVVGVWFLRSPEYALLNMASDVEESGIDGLLPYLTDDAEKTVSSIVEISENKFVSTIISFFSDEDYTGVLKSNLKDVQWELNDILKGDDKAEVVLNFNYKDQLTGTIEINMIRKDGDWKISGINLPDFEKIELGE